MTTAPVLHPPGAVEVLDLAGAFLRMGLTLFLGRFLFLSVLTDSLLVLSRRLLTRLGLRRASVAFLNQLNSSRRIDRNARRRRDGDGQCQHEDRPSKSGHS